MERTADGEPFVFFEGPPTANGRPGIHHVFSRTIKDTVARFRTMQGRYVPADGGVGHARAARSRSRRSAAGHLGEAGDRAGGDRALQRGLPRERADLHGGVGALLRRIGYWLDYSNPYVTYHADYIESIWWSLKQIADRGLIYRGHKILPYCPRCGTGLSSHEVAQGYREVRDPSLYLTMERTGGEAEGREFLVWTTTPWTLVSNVALAVHPELEYAEVARGAAMILAKERVPALFGEEARGGATDARRSWWGCATERPFDWVEARGRGRGARSERAGGWCRRTSCRRRRGRGSCTSRRLRRRRLRGGQEHGLPCCSRWTTAAPSTAPAGGRRASS
jgi:isoleucyl-tRNA synthetase